MHEIFRLMGASNEGDSSKGSLAKAVPLRVAERFLTFTAATLEYFNMDPMQRTPWLIGVLRFTRGHLYRARGEELAASFNFGNFDYIADFIERTSKERKMGNG